MKKTLIIITHPNMQDSNINRFWKETLSQYPDEFTVHDLYTTYPDGVINVAQEHALVESHGDIIFQFPLYWFSAPPLLKQWQDEVLTYGWAYGSQGNQLKGKKIGIAVSAGISKEGFSRQGHYMYSLDEVLRPFEMTATFVKANYHSYFALYNTDPSSESILTEAEIQQSAADYLLYLRAMHTTN